MKATRLRSMVLSSLAAASRLAMPQIIADGPPPLDIGYNTPLRQSPGFLNDYLRGEDPSLAAWNFGVQYRARYEGRENGGSTGAGSGADFSAKPNVANDNYYVLQKTLVRVGYTADWLDIFVQGRNSSSTGDKRPSTGILPGTGAGPESDGPFQLHQAYVTLGNLKELPVSVKVGRQEIFFGDERLVGSSGWNNVGRVFDGAKLRWENTWFAGDFFTAKLVLPDDNNFNVPNPYDYFSGAYLTSALVPKVSSQLYFFSRNAGQQATMPGPNSSSVVSSPRDIYTVGGRLVSSPKDWGQFDFFMEGAYQFGHFNDPAIPNASSRSLEQQAYMLVANASYSWDDTAWKPKAGLGYCLGSGDGNPNDGKRGTFDNLFPSNHRLYGFADLASLQNLQDLRFFSSFKPVSRVTVLAEAHGLWLADSHDNFYNVTGARRGGIGPTPGTGYGINPNYGTYLGVETDLVATWALSPYLSLEVAYCHFFRGDYIERSFSQVGSQDVDYVYIQTTLSF